MLQSSTISHFILITLLHKIKFWDDSATDEAIGMQRVHEKKGAWSTATRGGVCVSQKMTVLWSSGRKDHASSGTTKFALRMAQDNTDATSTGDNEGIWRNNSIFWNELINYAMRIAHRQTIHFSSFFFFWQLSHGESKT